LRGDSGTRVVDRISGEAIPIISRGTATFAKFVDNDRVLLVVYGGAEIEAFHLLTQSRLGKIYAIDDSELGGILNYRLTDQSTLEIIESRSDDIHRHHSIGVNRK